VTGFDTFICWTWWAKIEMTGMATTVITFVQVFNNIAGISSPHSGHYFMLIKREYLFFWLYSVYMIY
jgi:hypothetical protein